MELTLTTPALLFPAISLLFLSYNNKFLALASLIRSLVADYREHPENHVIKSQIHNLRTRMELIRHMQVAGIASFILCTVTMFLIYINWHTIAAVVFGISLLALIISLIICLAEIHISTRALKAHLQELEEHGLDY